LGQRRPLAIEDSIPESEADHGNTKLDYSRMRFVDHHGGPVD
jgi:hypothetical protein